MNNLIPTPTSKKPQSVCIAYIHNGIVHNDFMVSLFNMMTYDRANENYFHSLIHTSGSYIPQNRNTAIEMFLPTNAEWLFFLDNDMVFPPHSLKNMVETADPATIPILGALYFTYIGAQNHIAPAWLAPHENSDFVTLDTVNNTILTPLSVAGTGAMIIHRTVLERLKQEYAADPWPWFAHDIGIMIKNGIPSRLGEDVSFCIRAKQCGFPIYGHGGLIMEHKKTKLLGPIDFMYQYH